MKKSCMISMLVPFCGLLVFMVCAQGLSADSQSRDAVIRMRLYEGSRDNGAAGADKVISSYYLKPLSRENVTSEVEISKEQQTLKRVFNLADIKAMAVATLETSKEKSANPSSVIVLNGRKLTVELSAAGGQADKFKVEVLDKTGTSRSLLESNIILPENKSTVLGFEDSGGGIYFLSFHRQGDAVVPPFRRH
jgi:hypothetical protein